MSATFEVRLTHYRDGHGVSLWANDRAVVLARFDQNFWGAHCYATSVADVLQTKYNEVHDKDASMHPVYETSEGEPLSWAAEAEEFGKAIDLVEQAMGILDDAIGQNAYTEGLSDTLDKMQLHKSDREQREPEEETVEVYECPNCTHTYGFDEVPTNCVKCETSDDDFVLKEVTP